MSDQNGSDAWRKGPTFLQAAYQRAEVAKRPLDKQKSNVTSFSKTLSNIRRHKHVPICAPKGFIRQVPDRAAFMRVEAQERVNAITKHKSMNRSRDFSRATKARHKSRDHEMDM